MRLPGINSDAAWNVYLSLKRAECEWRKVNGLPQSTKYKHITVAVDGGRKCTRAVEVKPPSHPIYGRVIKLMFWLGFIPF